MNKDVTSIHEAGHAVISCFLDVPFTYAKLGFVWVDSQGEPTEGLIDPSRDPDGAGGVCYAPHQTLNARLEGLDWNTEEGMRKVHDAVTTEAAIRLAARVAIERSSRYPIQEVNFSSDDAYVEKIFNRYNRNPSLTLQQFREDILTKLRELFAKPCIWNAVEETAIKLLLANWAEESVPWETINAIVEPCKAQT